MVELVATTCGRNDDRESFSALRIKSCDDKPSPLATASYKPVQRRGCQSLSVSWCVAMRVCQSVDMLALPAAVVHGLRRFKTLQTDNCSNPPFPHPAPKKNNPRALPGKGG